MNVTIFCYHAIKFAAVFVISALVAEEMDLSWNSEKRIKSAAIINALVVLAVPLIASWYYSFNIIIGTVTTVNQS